MRLVSYGVAVLVVAVLILGLKPTSVQGTMQSGGLLFGSVYGFTMYDELVPLEWVTVTAMGGGQQFATSTGAGGDYEMFLPVGAYNVSISQPGYKPYSSSVAISDGSSSSVNVYLYESGLPIPEFPASALAIIGVIAVAAIFVTRKTRKFEMQNS